MEAPIPLDLTLRMRFCCAGRRPWLGPAVAVAAVGLMTAGCAGPREQPAPVRPGPIVQVPVYSPAPTTIPATRPTPPPVQARETIVSLGVSKESRPINMVILGQTGPMTLVLGGIHGNEPTSAGLALQLLRHLRDNPSDYQGRRVAVVTVVNPDGLIRGTRENANGVDLNRNFPASNFPANPSPTFPGGPYPVSEPETLAVLTALRLTKPAKIISIHSIRRGQHGNNYDGPARALALEMGRHNGYNTLSTMGYPTPGSFGTWAGVDQRIPTVTLELPRDADADTCWRENRDALLAAIRFPVEPDEEEVSEFDGGDESSVGK